MKVGVFHPGTQHSWQTAYALQQLGRLQWYATSIFYQPERWPYRLESLLPGPIGTRLGREFRRFSHAGLDPALVRTAGMAEWLERIASRSGRRKLARWLDRVGNRRFVSTIAQDLRSTEPFAVWGYNGSSESSFALARQFGRPCILDRTIGDFRIYNSMMAEIREQYGKWFLSTELAVPTEDIERDQREYLLADKIVIGSEYAAQTVEKAAADPAISAKISILKYCYDETLFTPPTAPARVPRDGPLRFLFVGLVVPRKGIHHVLEAIARIPKSAAELTIVGSLKVPPAAFAPYADRVTFIPAVPRSEVPRIMQEHDVLVLPSYFEGSPITLYEALASGCGLIQSHRCGQTVTPDTGIMLDEVSTDSVYSAMMRAIEDRDAVEDWRNAAPLLASRYGFANYRDNIAKLLDGMGL